jgi:hypothetical protein
MDNVQQHNPCKKVYELRHWTQLIHEPVLIDHIYLSQILHNKCVKKNGIQVSNPQECMKSPILFTTAATHNGRCMLK